MWWWWSAGVDNAVGFVGHHFEQGRAGPGRRGGHRVEEAGGEDGVEFGEGGREGIVRGGVHGLR